MPISLGENRQNTKITGAHSINTDRASLRRIHAVEVAGWDIYTHLQR